MIKITDADIEAVEKKFGNIKFDDESKTFIKCMSSQDIQACPGAGKTTALVAKLDILANYMPFNDNTGVLVLTHTNVAVNEIKKKLGANAQIVLSYPNFVGTFQSFIDKFLAIPMYIKLFGKKPERIDDEIYYNIFQKRFDNVNEFHKNWLQKRADEKYVSVLNFIEDFDIQDAAIKYKEKNIITTKSKMFNAIKTIADIPYSLIEDGYLKYSHCYKFALTYLQDYPNITKIFQKRFKYVFIDEAQDTDEIQFEILDKLFKNSDVVIQRIGDNNQAIFQYSSSNRNSFWEIDAQHLEIKNTKRLSSLISKQVEKVAISKQELNGNDDIKIKPHIILFEDNYIDEVIPQFAELIIENNLHKINNAVFKAVGSVAKPNEKGHTLPSYFKSYKKEDNCFSQHNTLQDKISNCIKKRLQPKEYRNMILDIIKEYLKSKDIYYEQDKPFSKRTILIYLKENNEQSYNDFKLKLFFIADKLAKNECVIEDLKSALSIILKIKNSVLDSTILEDIIKMYKYEKTKNLSSNTYKHSEENIEIQISTIHKVKGETHTATLVLETFKDGYDLFQIIDYLKGNNNKLNINHKKKILYVAMSRPTHLLCLAIHRSHIHRNKHKKVKDEDIEVLRNNGFKIIELKD